MSDDPTTPGTGAPDERDERLAALLAVPPLDEHTRARLVRRALDAAPAPSIRPRRRTLLVGAAAALAVVAVAGTVLLTSSGGAPPNQAARRAAPPRAAAAPRGPIATPGATTAAPRDLGPVGDVTDPGRLVQVLAGPASTTGGSLERIREACGTADGSTVGVTRIDTVATGVDAGQPVAILVGPDPRGRRVAVAVRLADCIPVQRIALP